MVCSVCCNSSVHVFLSTPTAYVISGQWHYGICLVHEDRLQGKVLELFRKENVFLLLHYV
jgi:hypothetical protein